MTETIVAATEVTTQMAETGMSDTVNALFSSVAGMVGIFAVVGIIIITVSLLNKLGNGRKKDK